MLGRSTLMAPRRVFRTSPTLSWMEPEMHLRHAGAGDGLPVEAGKTCSTGRHGKCLQYAAHIRGSERRYRSCSRELTGDVGRNQVRPRGKYLAELTKIGPSVLCAAQALATRNGMATHAEQLAESAQRGWGHRAARTRRARNGGKNGRRFWPDGRDACRDSVWGVRALRGQTGKPLLYLPQRRRQCPGNVVHRSTPMKLPHLIRFV